MIKPIILTEADITRFWSKVDICGPDDCWEWLGGYFRTDYGLFSINRSPYLAHRVAYTIKYGDTDLFVCHHCDNRACCNPAHLFAGTQIDNMRDCAQKGGFNPRLGELNNRAILTKDDVIEIKRLINQGMMQTLIANQFNVSKSTITDIKMNRSWSHG